MTWVGLAFDYETVLMEAFKAISGLLKSGKVGDLPAVEICGPGPVSVGDSVGWWAGAIAHRTSFGDDKIEIGMHIAMRSPLLGEKPAQEPAVLDLLRPEGPIRVFLSPAQQNTYAIRVDTQFGPVQIELPAQIATRVVERVEAGGVAIVLRESTRTRAVPNPDRWPLTELLE